MKYNTSTKIKKNSEKFNNFFHKLLLKKLPKESLSEVIIYGAMNGGKRIRPFLIDTFSEIVGLKKNNSLYLSAAVECIHSYSLIHDDLPSMDDDDYRRGKLSVHKKYNEAEAILAGDSLHDLAFEILSDNLIHDSYKIRLELINLLSVSTGIKGLAGGQSLDLKFENKKISKKNIIKMYKMKTGKLFEYSCLSPFLIAKRSNREIKFAKNFGSNFGLVFQIIDDYLDLISDYNLLGKTPGKDKIQGKSTIINHINKRNIIDFCEKLIEDFISNNKLYFNKWNHLEEIIRYIIKRKY